MPCSHSTTTLLSTHTTRQEPQTKQRIKKKLVIHAGRYAHPALTVCDVVHAKAQQATTKRRQYVCVWEKSHFTGERATVANFTLIPTGWFQCFEGVCVFVCGVHSRILFAHIHPEKHTNVPTKTQTRSKDSKIPSQQTT